MEITSFHPPGSSESWCSDLRLAHNQGLGETQASPKTACQREAETRLGPGVCLRGLGSESPSQTSLKVSEGWRECNVFCAQELTSLGMFSASSLP